MSEENLYLRKLLPAWFILVIGQHLRSQSRRRLSEDVRGMFSKRFQRIQTLKGSAYVHLDDRRVQGYLAHEKTPPPMTLQ